MGTVSLIWNTFVPVLMALWAILVLGNLQWDVTAFLSLIPVTRVPTPEEWEILITFYSFFLISVPLFLLGFGPHFADRSGGPKDGGFRLRATTMLILFALLLILCLFFDWMLLILLCAGVIFVVIWLLEAREIIPSGHKMDYVPVFVWIQRGTDGNWSGRCATWDYAHYHARTVEYAKVQTHPKDSDKILLDMTDNWHALEMGGEVGRMSLWMSVLFVLVFNSIVFLTFFWSGTYYPSTVINLVLFVILPSLAVALCLVLVRKRFDLVKQLEYFIKDEAHLSMEKLVILWNLEEKPRLKIVNKLQNPFADFRDGICFDNFND